MAEAEEKVLNFPEKVYRLVLTGKTGNGKSSTGDALLGREYFDVGDSATSATNRCLWGNVDRFGVSIEIVDTPGIFDTNLDDAVVTKELVRCIGQVAPGPHAILFTIRADARFTKEEAMTMDYLQQLFGESIMKYVIVIFTHGDHLTKRGLSIHDFVQSSPKDLMDILEKTNNRYVVFDNTLDLKSEANTLQVRQLMESFQDLLTHTNNSHFTNPFLLHSEEIVVASTRTIAEMFDSDPTSPTVRALVMQCLQAKDNFEELLDEAHKSQSAYESEIQRLMNTLKDTLAEKTSSEAEIRERHETEMKQIKEETDNKMKIKDAEIQERDEKIKAKEAEIKEREEKAKDAEIQERDEKLKAKEAEIKEREEKLINEAQHAIDELEKGLREEFEKEKKILENELNKAKKKKIKCCIM